MVIVHTYVNQKVYVASFPHNLISSMHFHTNYMQDTSHSSSDISIPTFSKILYTHTIFFIPYISIAFTMLTSTPRNIGRRVSSSSSVWLRLAAPLSNSQLRLAHRGSPWEKPVMDQTYIWWEYSGIY